MEYVVPYSQYHAYELSRPLISGQSMAYSTVGVYSCPDRSGDLIN